MGINAAKFNVLKVAVICHESTLTPLQDFIISSYFCQEVIRRYL